MYIKNPAHGLSRQRKGSGSTQEMDGWEAEGRKKGRKEGREGVSRQRKGKLPERAIIHTLSLCLQLHLNLQPRTREIQLTYIFNSVVYVCPRFPQFDAHPGEF